MAAKNSESAKFFRSCWAQGCVSLLLLFVLVSGLVMVVGYIVRANPMPGAADLPFDSAAWKAHPDTRGTAAGSEVEYPVRQRMVHDLLAKQKCIGMSREQVLDLLGEPGPYDRFSGSDLAYRMGKVRGLGVDSEWLVFRFDEKGKVKEFALRQD